MKSSQKGKRFTAALLTLSFFFAVSVAGTVGAAQEIAQPSVTISEAGGKAVIRLSSANLFENFQNVMPGDSRNQKITIRADGKNSSYYNLYLYARECAYSEEVSGVSSETGVHSADPQFYNPDFLKQLTIQVKKGASELGGTDIGDGGNGILLGTFQPGASIELEVSLLVDLEMGNAFQNAQTYIDWIFYAQENNPYVPPVPPTPESSTPAEEEIPEESVPAAGPSSPTEEEIEEEGVPTVDAPQTGRGAGLLIWLTMAVCTGFGIVLLIVANRKENNRNR